MVILVRLLILLFILITTILLWRRSFRKWWSILPWKVLKDSLDKGSKLFLGIMLFWRIWFVKVKMENLLWCLFDTSKERFTTKERGQLDNLKETMKEKKLNFRSSLTSKKKSMTKRKNKRRRKMKNNKKRKRLKINLS